jgi:hypothetical protein
MPSKRKVNPGFHTNIHVGTGTVAAICCGKPPWPTAFSAAADALPNYTSETGCQTEYRTARTAFLLNLALPNLCTS